MVLNFEIQCYSCICEPIVVFLFFHWSRLCLIFDCLNIPGIMFLFSYYFNCVCFFFLSLHHFLIVVRKMLFSSFLFLFSENHTNWRSISIFWCFLVDVTRISTIFQVAVVSNEIASEVVIIYQHLEH